MERIRRFITVRRQWLESTELRVGHYPNHMTWFQACMRYGSLYRGHDFNRFEHAGNNLFLSEEP